MKYRYLLPVMSLIVILCACRAPEASPTVISPTPTRGLLPTFTRPAVPTVTAEASPTPTVEASATATPVQPGASPTALTIRLEPTLTPHPRDDRVSVDDLPIGEPGNYVNVTFGYWLQYPRSWYTGFGNRPLLVSFSNLDPGTRNRDSMRNEGCLIEVNAWVNVYGIPLPDLLAQIPRSFPNAEAFELGGEPAVLVRPTDYEAPVQTETILAQHDDWIITLALDHSRDAAEICRPAWDNLLASWQWFEPDFATYRNTNYGYAISYPRDWYRFNAHERGVLISSVDPTGARDLVELARQGMVVETDRLENPHNLPLKTWLAEQDQDIDLTNDIPLYEGLMGVRVLREGSSPQIQEISGYFEGPLGGIYVVSCRYPVDRQWEFRPLANAILYSFSF
jgi:hypothetical protein